MVLTAAVVGLGNIGVEHVRALVSIPEARVVGVCDRSFATARAVAERWALQDGAHDDLGQLLHSLRPDVVHIATPPSSHVDLALQCLRAGAHVLVEKPLADSPDRLDALLTVAEQENLHVVENYNYLWNRQLVQLRAWVQDGRLGDVVHVDAEIALDVLGKGSPFTAEHGNHFALGLRGGLVSDFLPHLASVADAFLGDHHSAVAFWSKRGQSRLPADEWRALVRHATGTSSLGFSAHAKPVGFRVTVIGTRMRVRADLYGTLLAVEEARTAPSPLVPVLNGIAVSRAELSGAFVGLKRKLDGGPAALEGLWGLLHQLYGDLSRGAPPAISHDRLRQVNRLTAALSADAP